MKKLALVVALVAFGAVSASAGEYPVKVTNPAGFAADKLAKADAAKVMVDRSSGDILVNAWRFSADRD